jgi:hypothetical protein
MRGEYGFRANAWQLTVTGVLTVLIGCTLQLHSVRRHPLAAVPLALHDPPPSECGVRVCGRWWCSTRRGGSSRRRATRASWRSWRPSRWPRYVGGRGGGNAAVHGESVSPGAVRAAVAGEVAGEDGGGRHLSLVRWWVVVGVRITYAAVRLTAAR